MIKLEEKNIYLCSSDNKEKLRAVYKLLVSMDKEVYCPLIDDEKTISGLAKKIENSEIAIAISEEPTTIRELKERMLISLCGKRFIIFNIKQDGNNRDNSQTKE
jgi:hypothetical protein